MRRILYTLTAGSLAAVLFLSSAVAVLSPIRSYDEAGFTDIPNDWSRSYIITCYELGLLSGRGNGTFDPTGTLSVSEAIMVTARVHDLWRGGSGDFPSEDSWFSGAVAYAIENGIIVAGEFPDYFSAATRTQLAVLLSRALPPSDYAPINTISALPDVTSDSLYYDNILTLYKTGILTGTDTSGTFLPNASITRAELAAILCRLVLPETRQKITLQSSVASSDIPTLDEMTFGETIRSNSCTAVLFFTDWCQSCQAFFPTFNQLALQFGDRITTGQINVDQYSALADYYDITIIPTVIFFQNGEEINRIENNNPLETYVDFLSAGYD